MPNVIQEAIAIESRGRRLVGFWHGGAGPRTGAAVVFCHPLFEEKKSSHRVLVETARHMAARGIAVLRFDLSGCGDSPGEFDEVSLPDWIDDVQAALQAAARRAPEAELGLLGLRFGAALAAEVAERTRDLGSLILWEPVLRGQDYIAADLRKKLIKEMMTHGRATQSRRELMERLEGDATIDFDGFPVTSRLYKDLAGLQLDGPKTYGGRLLIVQVGPRDEVSGGLREFGSTYAGGRVDLLAARELPFWNLIGLVECPGLMAKTTDWLLTRKP